MSQDVVRIWVASIIEQVSYQSLNSYVLLKWKDKLCYGDFIATKFKNKERENKSKGEGKKLGLDARVQVRAKGSGSEKQRSEFVLQEV